jgi:hypothetical protein
MPLMPPALRNGREFRILHGLRKSARLDKPSPDTMVVMIPEMGMISGRKKALPPITEASALLVASLLYARKSFIKPPCDIERRYFLHSCARLLFLIWVAK